MNFPTSPSLNDTYSLGAKTWKWNGAAWDLQSVGLTSAHLITALGYTPANKAGDTFSGNVTIANGTDSRTNLQVSGVTEGIVSANATRILLGSVNAIPMILSTNGVTRVTLTGTGFITTGASEYVGIGAQAGTNNSLRVARNLENGTSSYGVLSDGTFQAGVTTSGQQYRSVLRTQAASFTMASVAHYAAVQATLGAGSVVTNQVGFLVESSLTGATNNYGFRGQIAAGTSRWNLYMDGTAVNYLEGSLGIGTSSPTEKLTVNGNIKLGTSGTSWLYGPSTTGRSILSNSDSTAYVVLYGSSYGGSNDAGLQFTAGTSNSMIFNSAGNLGLGVTPSAWATSNSTRAMQFPGGGTVWGQNFAGNNPSIQVACNAYLDSGGYKYFQTAEASQYQQNAGNHAWMRAASGTAGSAITWTSVMTLDASSNLTVTGNVTAYSDERLKTDWSNLSSDFIDRLARVKNGTYTRIDNGARQAGSSAQDWQALLPEVVLEGDDEAKTLSLAYGNAALVSAVELAKRVVRLETMVKAMMGA